MRKVSVLIVFSICLSIAYTQPKPKLLVKIKSEQTGVTLYTHVLMQAWLYNKGTSAISMFRQDFTAPAWYGVIERWYCRHEQKKDTFPKVMEPPTSGFNENNIINLAPGDSLMVDTIGYTFYQSGSYAFTYNILASRKKVRKYYAMTSLAKKKVAAITEFNVTSVPLTITCKTGAFSSGKVVDLTLEEVTKTKKVFSSLTEAFRNPENVFRLALEGPLMLRDLKAINFLRNIHVLCFSNIRLNKNVNRPDTLLFDLPNLKELSIEDSQIDITDSFLVNFPKLEIISCKNVPYHYPSQTLHKLTAIQAISLENCQIISLTVDFSKLQKLHKIELMGNNLQEAPLINGLPKLEYLDLRENKLNVFPDVPNDISLKKVCLARNNITTVPEVIGKLEGLTSLDLSWNNISSLPPQICYLDSLTTLMLTGNQISHLPDKIKKLSQLKVLFLDENKYSVIDPVLFKLSTLEQLVLSKNDIAILPDNFSKLTHLSQLDITGNKITQLPGSLLRLKQLNILKVHENPINENKTTRALQTKLQAGYYN